MLHFEELWEKAESLSGGPAKESYNKISKILNSGTESLSEAQMGEIIFQLCNLSRIYNINTFVALNKNIIDKQSEKLEQKF